MADILTDWQNGTNPPISYEIKQQDDRIDIEFAGGRSIWIELEDGIVRVHCYDEQHDEPMNVEITEYSVEIDDFDYRGDCEE